MTSHRLVRALLRQPVDCTPVWLMRQAGRYLPEYRALREKVSDFMGLCMEPELACEVTMQPLRRFDLDAAIIFSDILTIPHAMGLGLHFITGEGPCFSKPLTSKRAIEALGIPDPEQDLRYVLDAIRLTRRELAGKQPLIGFCGSPWTIAAYMLEGKADKNFNAIRNLKQEDPASLHLLLSRLTESIQLHLNAQIKAGADVVMLFDTWAGLLDASTYREFSLSYIEQIVSDLLPMYRDTRIPVIVFAKDCAHALPALAEIGCDALGVDALTDIGHARELVNDKVALQGNLPPESLYKSPATLLEDVKYVLASYGKGSGHIFNLGHGIRPDVDPEQVQRLVKAVHQFSRQYHQTS